MGKIPINNVDVSNIPQHSLQQYSKEELQHIARYCMQRHDMKLVRLRWEIIENATTKHQLQRIIDKLNGWDKS